MKEDRALILLENADRQIAQASTIGEAKDTKDSFRAIEVYARRARKGPAIVGKAVGCQLKAERHMGDLIRAMKERGELREGRPAKKLSRKGIVSLSRLGLSLKESSRAQFISLIDPESFARCLAVSMARLSVDAGVQMIRRQVADRKHPRPTNTPPMPRRTYRALVIDPPWPLGNSDRSARPDQGSKLPYHTWSLEKIRELPVGELSEPMTHLYLWVTQRFLPAGFDLLRHWGFRYHCLLTWVKPSGMTPYSFMFNTEHVLFGFKETFRAGKQGLKVAFEAPSSRGAHSTKPEAFFDLVRQFSIGPRLEMFARTKREGFDAWGNEV